MATATNHSSTEQAGWKGAGILPDTLRMGPVEIRVADLYRSLRFYQEVLGFSEVQQGDGRATLSVAGEPLLVLHEVPGARPVPERATGLFHVAILLPTRADLGRALRRLIEARVPVGQGDHLVSEALYLSDPDGNGIEIYRDRPREEWKWVNGQVQMATDPVDLEGVLRAAEVEGPGPDTLPAGTTIGHTHLKVNNIPEARQFYQGVLGFDVVAEWDSALFISAGGYHHHLGMNTWHSRGAAPGPESAAGLASYTIYLPDRASLDQLAARLQAASVEATTHESGLRFQDPAGNKVIVAIPA